ncbi:MAG: hypothetical protein K9G76_07170 [Bacteroidales bacterium]|nr:hypothetical protein [Bacteroidales bacterium]MCF8404567.1 hypothetical protein [Bacteroidales bacterium]
MKKSRYLIIGILLCSIQPTYSSEPDEWAGPQERVFFSNWSININIGATSYFGDLSQYDLNPIKKLGYESKLAYGFNITKRIKYFEVAGQVIYGGLKSKYRPEQSFETRIVEYSLQAGLDITKVLFPHNTGKYGLDVYVGSGQFMFKTTAYNVFDGLQIPVETGTGVPEFVYFFGCRLNVKVSEKIKITSDLSIRQAQNDNIDRYIANGDFDYYSFLNIGVSYSFGQIFKPIKDESKQKVNKRVPVWRAENK